MRVFKGLLIVAIGALVASEVVAEDWPMWRGANANGITSEEIVPSDKILWTKKLGTSFSCPVIKDGKLITLANTNGKDTLSCLNPETGEEIWAVTADGGRASRYPGSRSTPTTDGKHIWYLSGNGTLRCLDFATGKEVWTHKTSTTSLRFAASSSVAICDDLAIINCGGAGLAVNKLTGKEVWKSTGTPTYSTPAVFNLDGKDFVAILSGKKFAVVEAKTGKIIGEAPWEQDYDISGATPVIIDDGSRIFVTSGYKKTGKGVMFYFDGENLLELWSVTHMNSKFATPVYLDGVIYGSNGDEGSRNALTAIDAETGKVLWNGTRRFGSMLIAGDTIVYLEETGDLNFLKVNKTKEELIKTVSILAEARAKSWQMPVVANGYLYAMNSLGTLVCMKVK